MTVGARAGQGELWMRLLRTLTAASVSWTVWKNADAGLSGEGDVDFLAPAEDWDLIEHEFLRWARDVGLGPVIVCRHLPGALFLAALPAGPGRWLQLDVRAYVTFRGALLLRPVEAASASLGEMDERGFRRLRPGVEGLVKLVVSGVGPGGRPKPRGLAKEGVVELLQRDPAGMEAGTRLFDPFDGVALRGARAASIGGWDRAAMAALEASALVRALARPPVLAGQALGRRAKRVCVLLRTGIRAGRMVPEPRSAWLEEVAGSHIVHGWSPPDG
jgi:hypothetical protein